MRAISQLNGGFVLMDLCWVVPGQGGSFVPSLPTSTPPLSNLINPTNPNKKSHKSKSKLHKSRKMLCNEFLLIFLSQKSLIFGIKAQGQAVQGITLRGVAIKGFDDKGRIGAKSANWSNQENTLES